MTKFEEYQLLFYERELEKKEKIIEELLWENRILARANLKLGRENRVLSDAIINIGFSIYKIIEHNNLLIKNGGNMN